LFYPNREWLRYLAHTVQECYELTETGYTISRQLLRGDNVSLEREKQLSDCPFCDCEVIGASLQEDGGYAVTCNNCGARGPLVETPVDSTPDERQAAVAESFVLWNKGGHW
jgi:restriction alleviation protein Lar